MGIDDRLKLRLATLGSQGKRPIMADTARGPFFRAVDDLAPEVREALRDDVWPVFKKMSAALDKQGRLGDPDDPNTISFYRTLASRPHTHPDSVHEAFMAWYREACADEDAAVLPLKAALAAWMNRFYLATAWVESTALRTICEWERDPKRTEEPTWFVPGTLGHDVTYTQEIIEVRLPSVTDLVLADAPSVKARFREAFKNVIDAAVERASEEAKGLGIQVAQPGGAEHHVEWLVRRQVCGESIKSIAVVENKRATVREAVIRLRKHLDLPKRPDAPPGRPVGAKPK
jgi:hypothetical protein